MACNLSNGGKSLSDEIVADSQDVGTDIHGKLAMVEVEEPPPLNVFQETHPLLLQLTTAPSVMDMVGWRAISNFSCES
ncbi:hypothetical protein AMTR_s00038p00187280 [Amborella trichopoda]|uniref:Uncharacterized protein n=1 Tax=Amborella trichopoda TaxID=13333 RepID=U5CWV7_AMBTC|nr:hypothetical protein AMTR_s00038p00187280 [Amborella trichopoda]